MSKEIFINLPVKSLERSVEFYSKIGFTFDKNFTDENATMMIVNDKASVMLLTEEFFQSFTKKPVGNPEKSPEVILALAAESNDDVDYQADKIEKAGGKIVDRYTESAEMYGIRFEDPDAHLWEIFYMDMKSVNRSE